MATERTPLMPVTDMKVNIDYLVNTLGFKLDNVSADGTTAKLSCQAALLMLQTEVGDGPPAMRGDLPEIQVRVEELAEVYKNALSRGAIIRRYLEFAKTEAGTGIRLFTVSLPEGQRLTVIG